VSVWSWLKLAVAVWLIRKAARITGWVLLAAAVFAAWPVTVVALAGYGRRGGGAGPPPG
jgi:hypothetical protein